MAVKAGSSPAVFQDLHGYLHHDVDGTRSKSTTGVPWLRKVWAGAARVPREEAGGVGAC